MDRVNTPPAGPQNPPQQPIAADTQPDNDVPTRTARCYGERLLNAVTTWEHQRLDPSRESYLCTRGFVRLFALGGIGFSLAVWAVEFLVRALFDALAYVFDKLKVCCSPRGAS